MHTLTALMVMLTMAVTLLTAPRIYGDWLRFRTFAREDDLDSLFILQRQAREWILRHSLCTLAGLVIVVMLQLFPELAPPEHLAEAIAVYAMLSFGFAVVESLLAEKVAQQLISMMLPVKLQHDK